MTAKQSGTLQEIERLINKFGGEVAFVCKGKPDADPAAAKASAMSAISRVVLDGERMRSAYVIAHEQAMENGAAAHAAEASAMKLEARIAVLEEALRKYGDHKEGCGKRSFWASQRECECGFSAALVVDTAGTEKEIKAHE